MEKGLVNTFVQMEPFHFGGRLITEEISTKQHGRDCVLLLIGEPSLALGHC